jgi:probable O-glycosylation ligase (exosortase A-associated)
VRDLLVVAIVLAAAPVCILVPYFGVLMSSWIAYFNPHRFAYSFATTFPVAQVIVIPTMIGAVFTKDRNHKFITRETALLLLFWVWMAITLTNAYFEPVFFDHLVDAKLRMIEISKIMITTFLAILLVTSKQKLRYLLIVTAFCFGVLAVKGTIFGILTGGQFRVWGPPNSFVADNNDFGLALNMTIPMLFFLARDEQNRKLKILFRATFICGAVAVLLTYSRGALLGLCAVLAVTAFRSRYKGLSVAMIVLAAFLVVTFAPGKWMGRMSDLFGGNLDESAQERITSWQFAWTFTKHYPITGGSFETFTPALFSMYSPRDPRTWLAGHTSSGPHSIYFQVMAEQGFVGLAIFLTLLLSCLFSARRLRKRVKPFPELSWVTTYSYIVDTSVIGYMVSGAFLGRAYFDLYLQLVAILILLKLIARKELRSLQRRSAVIEVPAQEVEPELQPALP